MIDIYFIGLSELQEKLRQMPDALNDALAAKSQALAEALAQYVQEDKLSGEVLQEKTGALKDSIESASEETGQGAGASVFVAGDVPYAAILEYGGTTKAHVIEAANGKALAFSFQGKQAFFMRVNHPGSNIPEHSYLRSALDDMQDEIVDGLADALGDAITG
jgi:phage gpG-like protein